MQENQTRVQARLLDSLVILQSSPTFRKFAIQSQKPKSRAHLDTISVQWGEEDELVLPIVARIPDDVVQRDPIEECYGENCSLEFHHRKILSSKLVSII